MRRITIIFFGITVIGIGLILAWYFSGVKIEKMNSMVYCSCGYTQVEFSHGKIILIKYHHDNAKPGDQIGTYTVSGNLVDITINFGGKSFPVSCEIDNIGLRIIGDSLWKYQALDSGSYKTFIYKLLRKFEMA
jgi:hypothetical protein